MFVLAGWLENKGSNVDVCVVESGEDCHRRKYIETESSSLSTETLR
jgi:hypothetical protein